MSEKVILNMEQFSLALCAFVDAMEKIFSLKKIIYQIK
jgi:hypothetical protein